MDEPMSSTAGRARGRARFMALDIGGVNRREGTGDVGKGGRALGRGTTRLYQHLNDLVVTRQPNALSKQGSGGEPVNLYANFFKLQNKVNWHIYQYHVDFNPVIEDFRQCRRLIYGQKETLGKAFIFDGTLLFMAHKLEKDPLEIFVEQTNGTKTRITIKMTNELPKFDYQMIQIFGLLVRRSMANLGYKLIGRNYFDDHNVDNIQEFRLKLFPGYFTAIQQKENSILMCAAITHKVVRMDTVLDIMNQCKHQNRRNYQEICAQQLLGVIVMTFYNNRTYRIDNIDWDKHPGMTFKKGNVDVTYRDYYLNAYNVKIQHSDQPLLVNKPKRREMRAGQTGPIYLVPELCVMTGLDDQMRNNFQLMKRLAEFTRLEPHNRMEMTQKLGSQIARNEQVRQDFQDWGLGFTERLLQLKGRILPPEPILQAHITYTYIQGNVEWSKDVRSNCLDIPIQLREWALLFPNNQEQAADQFIMNIMKVTNPLGMQVSRPRLLKLHNDQVPTYANALRQCISHHMQLVTCIVPNNRRDRYDAIKKICCVDSPIPSQVIVARSLQRNAMSICTKIALQLNCKLGGELYHVRIPAKQVMVVGYDAYHDSLRKGRSVGAVVCSLNDNLTRYYSTAIFHDNQEELTSQFSSAITKGLRAYYDLNKKMPSRIIVYRDGVGEGQLRYVVDHEVDTIRNSLRAQKISAGFAFVVVTKRDPARFFASNNGRVTNPPSGTIVDDDTTNPEWTDFYLVSQSVRQGTVSPTHYHILINEVNVKISDFQKFTYKLTHLYYNWPGTIRVPAPCQYAHKLAFLVGQSLHAEPAVHLSNKLFYL